MAEDNREFSPKKPLHDRQAALAAIKRAQKKGTWPEREPQNEGNPREEKQYPTPEEQKKALASIPFSYETIPSIIKKELTAEAKKLNTMMMEKAEPEPKKVSPPNPNQPISQSDKYEGIGIKEILRQGATKAESLKRVPPLPAKEEESFPLPPSQRPYVKPPPLKPVPIAEPPLPPEQRLRQQIRKAPVDVSPNESYLKRIWKKLTGRV